MPIAVTFRLRTFGGLLIQGPDGPLTGAVTQRRRLAALALLAASRSGMSRDRLMAFLWPESTEERARHALAQLLYSVRRDLGEEVITGSATTLVLNRSVLESDVAELEASLQKGDLERAVVLYTGPFLDGFYLNGCAEFERWVEQERSRYHQRLLEALETMALAASGAGDHRRAVQLWRRAAALSPWDSRIALALAQALIAAGDPAGAIQHARVHTALIREELGESAEPAIAAFEASLPKAISEAGAEPWAGTAMAGSANVAAPPPEPAAATGGTTSAATLRDDAVVPADRAVMQRPRPWLRRLAGLTVLVAAAIGAAFWLRGGSAPVARPWLLIAGVENRTGDAVFDGTVPVALAAALAQSRTHQVTSPERVRQALVRMRLAGEDPVLDEELAIEVARREGIGLVIVPAVVRAGDGFEVSARILDPPTRGVLGLVSRGAASRADVLDALDELGRALRRQLGESRFAVATRTVPLPRVTTTSLDALKSYADGWRAFELGRWTEAETLWGQAVARDTSFTSAHAALGMLCYWLNRPLEGRAHFERALSNLAELPEREQVMVRASALSWSGNRDASVALLRTFLVANPDDADGWRRLGYDLLRLNRNAEAASVFRQVLANDSMAWRDWLNLATVERHEQPDSAVRHYRRAFALAPWAETGNDNINLEYGGTLLRAGDTAAAEATFAKMLELDRPRRARALRSMAFLSLLHGEYRRAAGQLTEAIAITRTLNAMISTMRNHLLLASVLDGLGNDAAARVQLDSAWALSQRAGIESTLLFWLGKALARQGDATRAAGLLRTMESRVTPGSRTDRAALEGLRGELLVAQGRARDGIAHLEAMLQADSSAITLESLAFGVAAAGDLDRAADLYTALGTDVVFGWEGQQYGRFAPYWLAQVEERRGNAAAAARAYSAFLDAWRTGDTDLPALADARARADRLRLADVPR